MPERAEPPLIIAYPNGPLLVRGNVEIRTPEGAPLPRRRRTVALCRCGKSTIKPYCDGTHKLIGFVTEPEGPETPTPSTG
ncbi:MAG: CDGSH iron-sulfur domain-containing protein [Actinomycetota bacterium]|nr:CDGSH iron-sulfur domain-containing protein [Actinomycetota bacterium]